MVNQIPNTEDIEFKPKFIERYSKLTDFEEFKRFSLSFLRKSIRVNTIKSDVPEIKKRLEDSWDLTPIPWCKEGFWIEHKGEEIDGEIKKRRDVGNIKEHTLGYFYVQEAASMIPPMVLDPKPGEKILDCCAAPGSKTTQIAMMMQNKGVLVANDKGSERLASLGINLQRCGVSNAIITDMQAQSIREKDFDRILVDAPCTGTGTIRKSLKTIRMWNPDMVKKISSIQKGILRKSFENLKKGGILVYSTCTLEPEENEGVVSWLLDKYDDAKIEEIKLDIKRSPAITEFEGEKYNEQVKHCLRIWPQDNDTEGFFVTKIRKL